LTHPRIKTLQNVERKSKCDTSNNRATQNISYRTKATYRESVKSRNCKKQPCWTLHMHFVKYYSTSTKNLAWEVTLHVPYILTTE